MPMPNKLSLAIVNDHHKPTPNLLNILKEANIEHDGTLQSILVETQKAWLRPADKERWETHTVLPLANDNLQSLLEDLYLVHSIKPSNKHYDHALLLGGTIIDVRNRLAYLITLWNSGVLFDSIVVLAGERLLDTTIESSKLLLTCNHTTLSFNKNWQFNGQLPQTETEMMKMVFDQTDIPTAWNTIPIIFVNTPMQKTENDSLRRPNTRDTINAWLQIFNPQSKSIIAISNQPFIGYQDAVLRNTLPKNFSVETVGCANLDNETTQIILDSLARWIYHEYQISLS